MKKCLLTLAMSLLLGSSIASAEMVKAPISAPKAEAAPLSRAATDDGYELRFCGDLYSWYSMFNSGSNYTYRFYIQVTPEVATSLAGNTLTDITFCPYLQSSATKSGTVFVTENLDGEPVVSQAETIKNGYDGQYLYIQTATLENPYVIKEGVGFAFGFTVSGCSGQDYPLAVDGTGPTAFAGYADLYDGAGNYVFSANIGEEIGLNMFLYANTVGEKKDLYNVFSVNGMTFDYSLPVFEAGSKKNVYAFINNMGSNPMTSLEYGYSINGADPVFAEIVTEIAPGDEGEVILPVETSVIGRGDIQIAITAINGEKYGAGVELPFIALDNEGYNRYFVVEEGTGTGCGYCPRGIVGMETMSELYPETFIGIAAHNDWFGADPMTVDSYQPFLNTYFTGLPSCIVNRDPIFIIDPSAEYLQMVYEYWASQRSAVDVNISVTKPAEDAKTFSVESTTEFAFDDADAKYALAFVITEDGIKGIQTNYFAGTGQPMGGWQSKPSRTTWTYSDTARDIFDVWGLDGSIPSSVEKGTAYDYKYEMSMANVKNIENTSVVALVLDKTTGTILNAKKVTYADYKDVSAVNAIDADANAPVEYYNIQGVRMDGNNLPAGMYIIRQGDKVQKTIIR